MNLSKATSRLLYWAVGAVLAITCIAIASILIFPLNSDSQVSLLGSVLFDRYSSSLKYPFTIQNLMWIIFFISVGELAFRFGVGRKEKAQLDRHLLPEDQETLLRPDDLPEFYTQIKNSDPSQSFWLQKVVGRAILQFQTSRSAARTDSLVTSTMDLFLHELELRYGLIRYFVWLIPTLGFIGTVIGIAFALQGAAEFFNEAGDVASIASVGGDLMVGLTRDLGVAFYTTLLALLQSAVLMLVLHFVQGQEEGALNDIGQYCLDNFVNRLYDYNLNEPKPI